MEFSFRFFVRLFFSVPFSVFRQKSDFSSFQNFLIDSLKSEKWDINVNRNKNNKIKIKIEGDKN